MKLYVISLFLLIIFLGCFQPNLRAAQMEAFILDLYIGEPVPLELMLDDISTTRIIYVGEIHTIARHHDFQTELLKELSKRDLRLALGMEMFSIEQQKIVDEWYNRGEDLNSLINRLGHEYWTNLKDYETLLNTARELNVPIVALNAPDKLVKKAAKEGLEGLNDSERKKIPKEAETINPLNERLLNLRLKVHRAFQDKSLDKIILAQAIRDETMAQTISSYLESPKGKERIMIVIAGTGHMNYGFGIPERTHRRNGLPFRIIIPTESGQLVLSEAEKRQAVPVHLTHEDFKFLQIPIADYLHVIPLQESGKNHFKEGVTKPE